MRKLFGVLFQDGALFGSMTLYDNVAFPRRHAIGPAGMTGRERLRAPARYPQRMDVSAPA